MKVTTKLQCCPNCSVFAFDGEYCYCCYYKDMKQMSKENDTEKILDEMWEDFDIEDEKTPQKKQTQEKKRTNTKAQKKKTQVPTTKAQKKAIVKQQPRMEFKDLTEISPDSIKNLLCPTADSTDIAKFMYFCREKGLNPFLGQCYLIKYHGPNKPASIITAKNEFLKRAELQGENDGIQAGIIVEQDGKEIIREGARLRDKEKLVGGWAKVYRKDRKYPYYSEVGKEYIKERGSWEDLPATMLRKVALVQSLREAYPDVFSGMYDKAEFEGRIKKE